MFITYKNIILHLFICNTFCEAQSDDAQPTRHVTLGIWHLTDIHTKHNKTKALTTVINTNATCMKNVFLYYYFSLQINHTSFAEYC
jgi:exo-beta-1,3-glucanase (GH17 family)